MPIIPRRGHPGQAWATSAHAFLSTARRSPPARALVIVALLALLSAVCHVPLMDLAAVFLAVYGKPPR